MDTGLLPIVCPVCKGDGTLPQTERGIRFRIRCHICIGRGKLPPLDIVENGGRYATWYWMCACAKDYVHPDNHDHCPLCGAIADDRPMCRIEDVIAWLNNIGVGDFSPG